MMNKVYDGEAEDLQQQVTDLEAMLNHASDTIARLEGRWRAPGAAKPCQRSLVIEQVSLCMMVAVCSRDGVWLRPSDCTEVRILAWRELPAIPSNEGFQELV